LGGGELFMIDVGGRRQINEGESPPIQGQSDLKPFVLSSKFYSHFFSESKLTEGKDTGANKVELLIL
jgi:hypothetical protein